MIHITRTALARAVEFIPGCDTEEKARAAMPMAAIQSAITNRAPFVKLGTGQHLVVRDHAVVTVLPKNMPLDCLGFDLVPYDLAHLTGE